MGKFFQCMTLCGNIRFHKRESLTEKNLKVKNKFWCLVLCSLKYVKHMEVGKLRNWEGK